MKQETATQNLNAALAETNRLHKDWLASVEAVIDAKDAFMETISAPAHLPSSYVPSTGSLYLPELAHMILTAHGRPMRVADLTTAIMADPRRRRDWSAANIGLQLRRCSDRFRFVRRGWYEAIPYAEAAQ